MGEVDKYVVYAQEHNQKTIATFGLTQIRTKSCRKKLEVHLERLQISSIHIHGKL